jgi:multiple sugar transport system permease protein
MGFFRQIPRDLLESARIEGCSEWKIFMKIVMPISRPVFGVMTLWTFYAVWPSFLWPYILSFFLDIEKWTFPVALFFAETKTPYPNIIMAVSVLAAIPTIIFFFIFQKFIQKGFVWSGIKG